MVFFVWSEVIHQMFQTTETLRRHAPDSWTVHLTYGNNSTLHDQKKSSDKTTSPLSSSWSNCSTKSLKDANRRLDQLLPNDKNGSGMKEMPDDKTGEDISNTGRIPRCLSSGSLLSQQFGVFSGVSSLLRHPPWFAVSPIACECNLADENGSGLE